MVNHAPKRTPSQPNETYSKVSGFEAKKEARHSELGIELPWPVEMLPLQGLIPAQRFRALLYK